MEHTIKSRRTGDQFWFQSRGATMQVCINDGQVNGHRNYHFNTCCVDGSFRGATVMHDGSVDDFKAKARAWYRKHQQAQAFS